MQKVEHWHVRVTPRMPLLDAHGRAVLADVRQIGLDHIEAVRSSRLYLLAGRLDAEQVDRLARELLADPVVETYACGPGFSHRQDEHPAIEIHSQPGVMNPAAMSTLQAAQRLVSSWGDPAVTVEQVQTARRYEVLGAGSASELDRIAANVLANDCIETWYLDGLGRSDAIPDTLPTPPSRPFERRHVPISGLADAELVRLSREAHLFLSLDEMRTIRDYFAEAGREPTDLEIESLAQTWSEHCVHKTLKSAIDYRGDAFGVVGTAIVHYDNLLKETIAAVTTTLDRDWCLSVFVDNAGVIAFDDEFGLAFKAETHNHPSAIEPYGGAATGIGGCIRDIMGCGLGAKPIASTDVFCLAPPDFDADRLPKDVLHPRRVLKGVVGGVRDYGNRMGIPTVNGAIYFDERYLANPLVFCGCVGLIPRDKIHKEPHPGDHVVVAGGRTGRDGIHGATFSSSELTDTHAQEFSHAVQIGHAIEEKKVLDALLLARDHPSGCLYSAVTDCGAGGLSSAVGEMAADLGAVVDLEKVPLKYAGLRYDEIWISEAQERMVFAVPPQKLDAFLAIFANEDVEATAIGTFSDDGRLRVRYDGQTVGDLDMNFLHDGLPMQTLQATWTASERAPRPTPPDDGCTSERLLAALGEINTASKEWVIRQYDHEVQGRSVVKPLMGPGAGPSDAAVVRPRYDSQRGAAIACGLCPQLGDIDPYVMAIAAIDEALRNVICVGANPDRVAILDNFCWPKVDTPEALGAMVRACRGARDAGLAFGLPFISGKDSLNNEYAMGAAEAARTGLPERIAIPYTLLISALGLVDDVNRCVTVDFKCPGSVLVVASEPVIMAREGGYAVRFDEAMAMHRRVSELIRTGKVRAAHDVSDGGLAVALAEMCIASGLGAAVDGAALRAFGGGGCLPPDRNVGLLLSPRTTTYVLEMDEVDVVESHLPIVGRVIEEARFTMIDGASTTADLSVKQLAKAWRTPLADGGGR